MSLRDNVPLARNSVIYPFAVAVREMDRNEELLDQPGGTSGTGPPHIWKHVIFAEKESGT